MLKDTVEESEGIPKSCKQEPGAFIPLIDVNRCEGKADCVAICPYDVFEMGILPVGERRSLSLKGKLKGFAHGWKQALVVNPEACRACGLCVSACPEKAIKISRS
jgi:4Fe-4S ferredoxin